jgi:hypothetical protein
MNAEIKLAKQRLSVLELAQSQGKEGDITFTLIC